mgnify:CR=1 FL=1
MSDTRYAIASVAPNCNLMSNHPTATDLHFPIGGQERGHSCILDTRHAFVGWAGVQAHIFVLFFVLFVIALCCIRAGLFPSFVPIFFFSFPHFSVFY